MNWKRVLGWAIVALAVTSVIGINMYKYREKKGDKPVVRVGVIAPLSGEYAQLGQELIKGIRLAVKHNKKEAFPIVILDEKDSKASTAESITAFQRLLFSNIQAAILVGDPATMAVSPLAIQNKIPTIATFAGEAGFVSQNQDRYLFLNFLPPRVAGIRTGKYAKDLGLKRVAILSLQAPEPLDLATGFKTGYGIPPVIHDTYNIIDTDARTQILRLLAKQPDGIFIAGYGMSYYRFIKALREQNYQGILMSNAAITDLKNIEVTDIANVIFSQAKHIRLEENPDYQKFEQEYMAEFNEKPTMFSRYGYDSMRLLLEGIQRVNGTTSAQIHEGLKTITSYDTFAGKLEFLPNGVSSLPTSIYKTNKDGLADLLEE